MLSHTFLHQVFLLTEELSLLISRFPSNTLLLLSQKYLNAIYRLAIFKNYDLDVKNIEVIGFIEYLFNELYSDDEKLLDVMI